MSEIAELCGVTAAEVRGTASFYDMLHTEPVGTYVVSVCTNIACLLGGALELLEHAESVLGVRAGGTTPDGVFTLHEAECLADCDRTPCVQVNHRYVGAQTPESFDALLDDLRAGRAVRDGARRTAPWCGCGAASACRPTGPPSSPSGRPMAEAQARPRRRGRGRAAETKPDGHHRRPQDHHRRASATRTPTRWSATWPPAATRGCARR